MVKSANQTITGPSILEGPYHNQNITTMATELSFLESVDFAPLTDKIKEVLGVDVELTISIIPTLSPRVRINSPNLVEHVGILKPIMEEVEVYCGNSVITLEPDGHLLWVIIGICCTDHSGERDGHDLFVAWFNTNGSKQWDFEL